MSKRSQRIARLEPIEIFNARGMRQVHAFDIRFANSRRKYSGEIWATKNDRLLVRFNCPTESDYDEAYELQGIKASEITAEKDAAASTDVEDVWPRWAPHCVVERWELWLSSVI